MYGASAVSVPFLSRPHFAMFRDTVDSVGLIPKRLPFTTSNTIVRTFRHAVSLDERRAKFKANLWNRPTVKDMSYSLDTNMPTSQSKKAEDTLPRRKRAKTEDSKVSGSVNSDIKVNDGPAEPTRPPLATVPATGTGKSSKSANGTKVPSIRKLKESKDDKRLTTLEKMYSTSQDTTDVEEVWFAVSSSSLW